MKKPEQNKRKFTMVARAGEIGIFLSLAKTRKRLLLSGAVATGGTLGVSFAASEWIRSSSDAPMLNILIIVLVLVVMIGAAYIDAMLLGDLFFPGRWRERILLGDKQIALDELELGRADLKEYSGHFILLILGMILFLGLVTQKVTGGFLDHYQKVGFALTLLRSDDDLDKLRGLRSIADGFHYESWDEPELHATLTKLAGETQNPEVLSALFYATGRIKVSDAGPPILKHFKELSDPKLRGEAGLALGRMGYSGALVDLSQALAKKNTPSVERLGILRGFSFWKDRRLVGATSGFLRSCRGPKRSQECSSEEVIFALYTLEMIGDYSGRRSAFDVLSSPAQEATLAERCAAIQSLGTMATRKEIKRLKKFFLQVPPETECETLEWHFRNEGMLMITHKSTMRTKVIRSLGNQKDFALHAWLVRINLNPDEVTETRNVAGSYANALLEAYEKECKGENALYGNCRRWKSIDQAELDAAKKRAKEKSETDEKTKNTE